MIKWIFNLSHSKKDNKPITKDDINIEIKSSSPSTIDFPSKYLFTQEDIISKTINKKLSNNGEDLIIRGEYDVNLKGINIVIGNLGISNFKIKSFENIKEIRGDLWFNEFNYKPLIESLGNLEIIRGKASIPHYIKSLGNLKFVDEENDWLTFAVLSVDWSSIINTSITNCLFIEIGILFKTHDIVFSAL